MDNPLGHASNQKVMQDGMPARAHHYYVCPDFSGESDDDLVGNAELNFGPALGVAFHNLGSHTGQFFRSRLLLPFDQQRRKRALNRLNNKYDQDLCLVGNGEVERVVNRIK